MQPLDIISVNLWQILISLCNLVILFLILKRFLFKPIKEILARRQSEINSHYKTAEEAEKSALATKVEFDEKMKNAKSQADDIIEKAALLADRRGEKIVVEAREKADVIIRQAQTEAELEIKKATSGIKREIVDVSTYLSEKILEREIKTEDHRNLIDSFISKIGEKHDEQEG